MLAFECSEIRRARKLHRFTLAVIGNQDPPECHVLNDFQAHLVAVTVLGDIRDTFLEDAEDRALNVIRNRRFDRCTDRHVELVFDHGCDLMDTDRKVDRIVMKLMHASSDIRHRFIYSAAYRFQIRLGLLVLVDDRDRLKLNDRTRQHMSDVIMDLSGDTVSFRQGRVSDLHVHVMGDLVFQLERLLRIVADIVKLVGEQCFLRIHISGLHGKNSRYNDQENGPVMHRDHGASDKYHDLQPGDLFRKDARNGLTPVLLSMEFRERFFGAFIGKESVDTDRDKDAHLGNEIRQKPGSHGKNDARDLVSYDFHDHADDENGKDRYDLFCPDIGSQRQTAVRSRIKQDQRHRKDRND